MRYVVRFGYDGTAFHGWARQPGLRTVEGEIRDGIRRLRLSSRTETPRLDVASRTDRGVSARANAIAVSSSLPGVALLRALNGIAPEIYFTAIADVPETFRVRSARRREYRYYEPFVGTNATRWTRAAKALEGDIDVRSFGRGIPADSPAVRTVESIRVRRRGPGLVLEVVGPSFVWNEVRRIVGALREVAEGRLSEERLRAAARGETRITAPLASAEPLVLWDVELPVEWKTFWQGPNRRQLAYWAGARASVWSRAQMLAELPEVSGRLRGPGPRTSSARAEP